MHNAAVAAGQTLTINGATLDNNDDVIFNGSAETDGSFNVTSGVGNDNLRGGAGNDLLNSGEAADDIIIEDGGNDTVLAGDGNDDIVAGGAFTASDSIDGGANGGGATPGDELILNGNYSAGVVFGATTLINVEFITVVAPFSYSLTTNEATVANGARLTVNATGLLAGQVLTFDGSAEEDGGFFTVNGGAGNDVLTDGNGGDTLNGGAGNDTFNLAQDGNDSAEGDDGDDTFNFGNEFSADDAINGGADGDTVNLIGDYSAGVVFIATTMANVETINLATGSDYSLTVHVDTLAGNDSMTVAANALGANDVVTFDASAEDDDTSAYNITPGAANDILTGGAGNDSFTLFRGGDDTATGGGGNDSFSFTFDTAFTANDKITGGIGSDTVSLNGNYTVAFTATTMLEVEQINLSAGNNFSLTTHDATIALNATLTVDGSALGMTNELTFDGSAETDGKFNLTGGAGEDTLTGGAGDDTINSGGLSDEVYIDDGGNDTVNAGDAGDFIEAGNALTATDIIDGGEGTDLLQVSGNSYAGGVTFGVQTMTNIEELFLVGGFDYTFTTVDATVALGERLIVNGINLGSGDVLNFNGSAEDDGDFDLRGGQANDILTGGNGVNTFDLTKGGDDTATGGGDDDVFTLGAALTATDQINGGGGSNTVNLNGSYAGLFFGSATMTNIQLLSLAANNYTLQVHDNTLSAGQTMTVDGTLLGSIHSLNFNALPETGATSAYSITGGAGDDGLTGGAGGDAFHLFMGGDDLASGAAGNDSFVFVFDTAFTASDRVAGGADSDTVTLNGNYTVIFTAMTMVEVEQINLSAGNDFNLTTHNATVASGETLIVNAGALGTGDSLTFNGSAETDGDFRIVSGNGQDTLTGGSQGDIFDYSQLTNLSAANRDIITSFNASNDQIAFDNDGVIGASGGVSEASIEADLTTLAGVGGAFELELNFAVDIQVTSGDLIGAHLVLIDANGDAGYQAGEDVVIQISALTGALTGANLIDP
jgi:Ca2+-binding RTX toxin-like protein